MGIPLSPDTLRRIDILIPQENRQEAIELLGEILSFPEEPHPLGLERIHLAALKVSGGDMKRLYEAIDLGLQDWRDLLVAAGFANDIHAHEKWLA